MYDICAHDTWVHHRGAGLGQAATSCALMFVAGSEYCAAAGWAFNQFGWFVEYRAPGGELVWPLATLRGGHGRHLVAVALMLAKALDEPNTVA